MPVGILIQEARALLGRPTWHRPDTLTRKGELNEIERTSRSLGIPLERLKEAVALGILKPFSKLDWSRLKNSKSWRIKTEAEAKKHAKERGRDIDKTYRGIDSGASLPAPVVLYREGERPYLIGGNHRLIAARTRGITPKVLHVYLRHA